jgi:TonB-dependent SusC/RagA subfamily outer membrane receptor
MKAKYLLLILLFTVQFSVKASDDKNIVPSDLKTVTVYKSGAELTHTSSAQLKQGNNELLIDNIGNQLDINSIQIKTASAVTIMGIEFSNNYLISTEKTPRQKMLTDSLETLLKESSKFDNAIRNNQELLEVLKSNRDIKGTQTGLSVAELMKLMDYYKQKSLEIQSDINQSIEKKNKLSENIQKLNLQIQEEQKKNISKSGRLILQLSVAMAGKYDFTISYISPNAYWTPYYDVRVDDIKTAMKIIYKAKISQTTGIDWKQVKLSLSTSLPSQWGNAPVFSTWFLGYINPVVAMNNFLFKQNSIQSFDKALEGKIAGVEVTDGYYKKEESLRIRGAKSISADNQPIYIVNGAEMSYEDFSKINTTSIKKIDVLKDASSTAIYGARGSQGVIVVTLKEGLQDYISVADNTLDLAFDIDLPYDVPTNGKQQTAVLKTLDVNAHYKHYAAPKLDKDAYLLAEITQWEKLNLLPGEANIIVENTYVGKSFIDPNSTSDTLNLTLGRDKRVSIKREKVTDYSSVKFLGSNKLQKFTYEITVKNNKKDAVDLLLKDQFPISTNKEIEVTIIETGDAAVNNDVGVLSWKLNLAPGESKKVRFAYSIKYPKDKTLNLN